MFAPKTDSIRLFVGGGVRRGGKGLCIVWITDKNFSIFRIGRRRFFGRPAAPFGGFFVPCIGVAVFRAVLSFFARSACLCPFWRRDLRAMVRGGRVFLRRSKDLLFYGRLVPVLFDVVVFLCRFQWLLVLRC